MLTFDQARTELLALLRKNSVKHGDFVLSSGARSPYYIDCRLTTLDPRGAWLVGQVMHTLITREATRTGAQIKAVGGLTMGADPVALAIAMYSAGPGRSAGSAEPLQAFVVRKAPKEHGQVKLVEGNFQPGDTVVVLDDVVTRGDSTLKAIEAVKGSGGNIAFVAVLVDRQQGGREKIEALGCRLVAAFNRDDLLDSGAGRDKGAGCVAA